jgi:2-iminoacetate synthase
MVNGIKIANKMSESDSESFIPHQEIYDLLEETKNPDSAEVRDILAKAMHMERLSPR